jgi:hypothetical protein
MIKYDNKSNCQKFYKQKEIYKPKDKCKSYYDNKKKKINTDNLSFEEVYNILIELDPTKNKKYCIWIIDQYTKGYFNLDDIKEVKDNINFYLNFIDRKIVRQLDNNYTYSDMVEDINKWSNIELSDNSIKKNGAIILYDGIYGLLVSPLTEEGSCEYGSRTKWCTAATISENLFSIYNVKGPLFIWKDGKTGNKYQFHFETGNFMDERDEPIDDEKLRCFIKDDQVIKVLFENKLKILLDLENNIYGAYKYCRALGKKWDELEKRIIENITLKKIKKDIDTGIEYASFVIKGRWYELEDIILNNINYITYLIIYAEKVIKGKWDKLEDLILKKDTYLYMKLGIDYAEKIIKDRWDEFEYLILNNEYYMKTVAIDYSVINGRWYELEDRILNNESYYINLGIDYSKKVIKDRWTELEKIILKKNDIDYGTNYAAKVIVGGRWTELEHLIINTKDFNIIIDYAINIGERWTELEDRILNNKSYLNLGIVYTLNVINERWEKYEDLLLNLYKKEYDIKYYYIAKEYELKVMNEKWGKLEDIKNKENQIS